MGRGGGVQSRNHIPTISKSLVWPFPAVCIGIHLNNFRFGNDEECGARGLAGPRLHRTRRRWQCHPKRRLGGRFRKRYVYIYTSFSTAYPKFPTPKTAGPCRALNKQTPPAQEATSDFSSIKVLCALNKNKIGKIINRLDNYFY